MLMLTVLALTVVNCQRVLEGEHTSMQLPLNDERTTEPTRLERMSLEYWTSLHQPLHCLLEPFDCPLEEYDQMFHGVITLQNVDVNGWNQFFNEATNENYLDINLILNQTLNIETQVFDILKFRYEWDSRYLDPNAVFGKVFQWRCFDMHWDREQYADITVNPVDDLSDFRSYNSKVKLDAHQDCIIDQEDSTITLEILEAEEGEEPGLQADFRVHFYRKLQTPAGVQDAQLSVGEVCDIGFSYNSNYAPGGAEPAADPAPEPAADDTPARNLQTVPSGAAQDQKAYYNYILDEPEYNAVFITIKSSAARIAVGFGMALTVLALS